uniref:Ovule protein n=1 Tax=Ascaris lumbricoides TaxID=6252 RepID=A0A0M3HW95_ASCLU
MKKRLSRCHMHQPLKLSFCNSPCAPHIFHAISLLQFGIRLFKACLTLNPFDILPYIRGGLHVFVVLLFSCSLVCPCLKRNQPGEFRPLSFEPGICLRFSRLNLQRAALYAAVYLWKTAEAIFVSKRNSDRGSMLIMSSANVPR